MRQIDKNFWRGRRVFVTGHMGFKGSWLAYVLSRLGAHVTGYGIDDREKLLYRQLRLPAHTHVEANINDLAKLSAAITDSRADTLFHLAAQPIVLASYEDPLRSFQDNIIGTANVLEACRHAPDMRTLIVVTSDKVYRNNDQGQAYREDDPLGGNDPYSASKAAAEIVTHSMIASFYKPQGIKRAASVRAGNVIGGGDWGAYRLLPDAARALSQGQPLIVRNPASTRPWQHVLEPVAAYMMLAEEMAKGGVPEFDAWNFGPDVADALPVAEIADLFVGGWGGGASWIADVPQGEVRHEAKFLSVDTARARTVLKWAPKWRVQEAVVRTAKWYKDAAGGADIHALMDRDIDAYFDL